MIFGGANQRYSIPSKQQWGLETYKFDFETGMFTFSNQS